MMGSKVYEFYITVIVILIVLIMALFGLAEFERRVTSEAGKPEDALTKSKAGVDFADNYTRFAAISSLHYTIWENGRRGGFACPAEKPNC